VTAASTPAPTVPPVPVLAALGRTVAGRFFKAVHQVPVGQIVGLPALVGVYVLLTAERGVVHLGQAARRGGVAARVAQHLALPERAAVTASIVVVELHEQTPLAALSAIEGQLAVALSLPGRLPGRRWPRAAHWPVTVGTADLAAVDGGTAGADAER
jgi:hypothetical protein